ncbi:MAG TPA: cupredoxin domain-containing protein [Anaerolineaceae bacterium]
MQALIGQRVSSDINLVAQILILIGLWVGFALARRKRIRQHQAVQTTMVLVNSFFILFIMVTSFYNYVIAGGTTTGTVATLMMVHGLFGLLAELTGIYLILRMSTKLLPIRLRVKNFRVVMRSLLGLWTVLVVLGLGIYYYRYLAPKPAPATNSSLQQLVFAADDLQIHADEMAQAVDRGNLETAKRHAEHIINLVAGKNGAGYGDADHNGVVEDPGTGVGLLTYLAQAGDEAKAQGTDSRTTQALLGQIRDAAQRLQADAQAIIRAQDLAGTTQPIEEAAGLANLLRDPQTGLVAQYAQGLHLSTARPTAAAGSSATGAGQTATVTMENFTFTPKTLQIKKGTTVIFINRDSARHTVTSDTGKFESGNLDAGQSFQFQFTETGQFPYYCRYHGDKGGVDMAGVITVTP